MRSHDAIVYELDDDGIAKVDDDDDVAEMGLWRRFLNSADRLLRRCTKTNEPAIEGAAAHARSSSGARVHSAELGLRAHSGLT
jgi:hypothetical protein